MSLVQWAEPKPCALSSPRFVKVRVFDGAGHVIPGEYRTKRKAPPTCASGDDAITSVCLNGTTYHLCSSCTMADLREYLGEPEPVVLPREYAAPAVEREGDLVLVRVTGTDTDALTAKLAAAGYRMRPRVRHAKRSGFLPCTVVVWEPA